MNDNDRYQQGSLGCKCHGRTFCPDLVCVGYEDDQPVFAHRDSAEARESPRLRARPAP